jgi:hypothetical protein
MEQYDIKVGIFCDVMADLGVFKVMQEYEDASRVLDPAATSSASVDSRTTENVIGGTVDTVEEELDGSEAASQSVATESEEESTPQSAQDSKTSLDDAMVEPALINSRASFVCSTIETVAVTEGLVITTDTTTDVATEAKPNLLL